MTTPSIATHSASVNQPVKKGLSAGEAGKTGQEAEIAGFDELLARETGDGIESSAASGVNKKRDSVAESMQGPANTGISEASVKSTKNDGRLKEKGGKDDLDSKIDLLVQQFMQAANIPPELAARQQASSSVGDPGKTGASFAGDGSAGMNRPLDSGSPSGSLQVNETDAGMFAAAMPGEPIQRGENFRNGVQETGIQPQPSGASSEAGRHEPVSTVTSGIREAMPGISRDTLQETGAARAGIAGNSGYVTDVTDVTDVKGTPARVGANTDTGVLRTGGKWGEFALDQASQGYEKHVEMQSERASLTGTQNSISTSGGAVPPPVAGDVATPQPPPQLLAPGDHSLLLHPRIESPGWSDALSQKVLWMVGQQQQTAELTLNPPDLGPLQVVLSLDNDQASALFVSQNADVRHALEAALPRLKEMMAETGISLGSMTVSAEGSHQQSWSDQPGHGNASGNSAPNNLTETSIGTDRSIRAIEARGLVDTFA